MSPDSKDAVAPHDAAADTDRLINLLAEAKALAREYYDLTGRPLGITGEIAEYEAARILGLTLAPPRQEGYDASRTVDGQLQKLQIKGRHIPGGARRSGQRVGSIRTDREWDAVLLVLLDEEFEATAIYEADRAPIIAALEAPGSLARNDRRQLAVTKLISLGRLVWRRPI